MANKFIHAIYDDDDKLLDAVKDLKENKVTIEEVFTPFPVHGLDHVMGLAPTRIAIAAFLYGCVGFTFALLMILSGGLGNLIDRSLWGHVIDFIHFYYENYSFYIFNLADTFITIGVIIYILDLLAMKLVSNANTTS